ncbi:hypothetical protein Efla_003265 [Eimeria flavescens]
MQFVKGDFSFVIEEQLQDLWISIAAERCEEENALNTYSSAASSDYVGCAGTAASFLGELAAVQAACLQLHREAAVASCGRPSPSASLRTEPTSSNSSCVDSSEGVVSALLPPKQLLQQLESLAARPDQRQHQQRSVHRGKMSKTALVAVAHGAEDIELVAPIDVLRRAGVKVVLASIHDDLSIKTAQGVCVEAEVLLKDLSKDEAFDVIIIPGGMKGATNCRDSGALKELVKKQHEAGRFIAAICASPAVVLTEWGLLDQAKAVAYPSFQSQLKHKGEGRVCVDKHFITSMGPGSAMEFALEIVKCLVGEAKSQEVKSGVCMP